MYRFKQIKARYSFVSEVIKPLGECSVYSKTEMIEVLPCLVEGLNFTFKGELQGLVEKDAVMEITGSFEHKTQGEHTLTVAQKLNIHSDSDANIEADGQMTVASQKNMYVKSKAKVDIAKG